MWRFLWETKAVLILTDAAGGGSAQPSAQVQTPGSAARETYAGSGRVINSDAGNHFLSE